MDLCGSEDEGAPGAQAAASGNRAHRVAHYKLWNLQRKIAELSAQVEAAVVEGRHLLVYRHAHKQRVVVELTDVERAQLENEHRKRMADILQRACGSMLKAVMSHKWAFPFNQPVDLLRYPTYTRVVSSPIDLGTIKTRVEEGAYREPREVWADVCRVFSNAKLFNPAGSDVHLMAQTLQEFAQERYDKGVVPRLAEESALMMREEVVAKRRRAESLNAADARAMEVQAARLLNVVEDLLQGVCEAKAAAAAMCEGLSGEELAALAARIAALPLQQLEAVVQLVASRHPGSLQPQGGEGPTRKVQLNLAKYDAVTLRQLQLFVDKCAATGSAAAAGAAQPQQAASGAATLATQVPADGSLAAQAAAALGEAAAGSKSEAMQVDADPPAADPPAARDQAQADAQQQQQQQQQQDKTDVGGMEVEAAAPAACSEPASSGGGQQPQQQAERHDHTASAAAPEPLAALPALTASAQAEGIGAAATAPGVAAPGAADAAGSVPAQEREADPSGAGAAGASAGAAAPAAAAGGNGLSRTISDVITAPSSSVSLSSKAGIQWPGVPLGAGLRARARAIVHDAEAASAGQQPQPPQTAPRPSHHQHQQGWFTPYTSPDGLLGPGSAHSGLTSLPSSGGTLPLSTGAKGGVKRRAPTPIQVDFSDIPGSEPRGAKSLRIPSTAAATPAAGEVPLPGASLVLQTHHVHLAPPAEQRVPQGGSGEAVAPASASQQHQPQSTLQGGATSEGALGQTTQSHASAAALSSENQQAPAGAAEPVSRPQAQSGSAEAGGAPAPPSSLLLAAAPIAAVPNTAVQPKDAAGASASEHIALGQSQKSSPVAAGTAASAQPQQPQPMVLDLTDVPHSRGITPAPPAVPPASSTPGSGGAVGAGSGLAGLAAAQTPEDAAAAAKAAALAAAQAAAEATMRQRLLAAANPAAVSNLNLHEQQGKLQ